MDRHGSEVVIVLAKQFVFVVEGVEVRHDRIDLFEVLDRVQDGL